MIEPAVLAPLRDPVFHDLGDVNAEIARRVHDVKTRPDADGSGDGRQGRFETIDAPHMRELPTRRWQPIVWRRNTVHRDDHIVVNRHADSVPSADVGKEVDVRIRGQIVDVFCDHKTIASPAVRDLRGGATTVRAHQSADAVDTRGQIEARAASLGPDVRPFISVIIKKFPHPELAFRACDGVLNLARAGEPGRLNPACHTARELGVETRKGLDNIMRTRVDLIAAEEAETTPYLHAHLRGADSDQ